jgi:hypothetical protein
MADMVPASFATAGHTSRPIIVLSTVVITAGRRAGRQAFQGVLDRSMRGRMRVGHPIRRRGCIATAHPPPVQVICSAWPINWLMVAAGLELT